MSKIYRLGDLAEIGRGSSPRPITDQRYFVNGDIPWIKIADATSSGKYIRETKEHVNEYGASFSRKLKPNTLIIAASGTLGFPKFLGCEGCIHDGWMYFSDIKTDLIEPDYLYYSLITLRGYYNNLSYGAAIQNINTPIVKKTKIELPALAEQRRVADILSAYDELIENNNRRISLLKKAAQELYKEWFVRFRFPGHETVKFENGIPENWRISTVKETFDIFDTKRIPLSSMDRDKMRKVYPYYGAAELMDYVDDYIFDGIYLLLGEDGSVITPAGKPVLQYVWGKMWVNNHAHVLQGKSPYSTEYLHLMFGQMDITGIVTGAAQPKISQGRLFKKKTILPTNDLILKFDSLIQPMYKSIRQLREANRNLAKQRDLLLPRLMSGKLEV